MYRVSTLVKIAMLLGYMKDALTVSERQNSGLRALEE